MTQASDISRWWAPDTKLLKPAPPELAEWEAQPRADDRSLTRAESNPHANSPAVPPRSLV